MPVLRQHWYRTSLTGIRQTVFAGLFLLLVSSGSASELDKLIIHESPRALPEFSFVTGEGEAISLQAWQNKLVVLNIWATWCAPCRDEMPSLDRLQARLGGENFEVVALSVDTGGADRVVSFFRDVEVAHLEVMLDPGGREARRLGTFGLPSTIIITSEGEELARLVGPAEWDDAEVVSLLESLIEEHAKRAEHSATPP